LRRDKRTDCKMTNTNRIASLDGLRGMGAVAVAFFYHYQMFGVEIPFEGIFKVVSDTGWLAVDIFFVISGFVISLTYQDKILADEISFWKFMKRRILHLYPIMHITLGVCTVEHLLYWIKTGKSYWFSYFDVKHFLFNFLGLQSGWFEATLSFNGPAWSISVEMFLYILFFAIARLGRKNENVIHIAEVIGILGGIIVLQEEVLLPIFNQLMARGVIGFFTGMIIKELWIKYKQGVFAERMVNVSNCLAVGGIAMWLLLCCFVGTESWIWGTQGLLLVFILVIAPATVWLALTGKIAGKVLSMRIFKMLGNVSLEIYMWHFPVIVLIILLDEYDVVHLLDKGYLLLVYFITVLVVGIIYRFLTARLLYKLKIRMEK